LLLLLLLLPGHNNSSTMVHAQMMMSDDDVNNCFIEPVGLECNIGSGSYFTARFGIPNKIDDNNKNKNDDDNNMTTAEQEDAEGGGGQRDIDCRYAWQVVVNDTGSGFFFISTTVTGSALTPSDPNCTVNCSAVLSSKNGLVFSSSEPTIMVIHHRLYILPILEGQNVSMEWDPIPPASTRLMNLPPPFRTLQVTADGVCSLEPPQTTTNPLASSGSSTFGSAMSLLSSSLSSTGLMMVALVVGGAVW
jgi:hypothetical protein